MSETQTKLADIQREVCSCCGKQISVEEAEYLPVADGDSRGVEAFCFPCAELVKEG